MSIIPGFTEASKAEMLIKKYKLTKSLSFRLGDLALMLELIKTSETIGFLSHHVCDALGAEFEVQALPEELKQDTFRRESALFCHSANRQTQFTHWLHQQLRHSLNDTSSSTPNKC